MNEKNTFWERAGKAGLVLGGVSILYMAITTLLGSADAGESVALRLVSLLLWVAKLVGCVLLMRFFMRRFSDAEPEADHSRVFRFGMMAALLSALLYSAAFLAYVTFIDPSVFERALAEAAMSNPMFNDAMMAEADKLLPVLPTFSFFFNLIYCFLFGTILAAIFANSIAPKNPFAE